MAKKLDLARWREEINTSWSLLTFAYFCSSSFSSCHNVRISANRWVLFFYLANVDIVTRHLRAFRSVVTRPMADSAYFSMRNFWEVFQGFLFTLNVILALSTCNSSSLRFSESSKALRSNGLWKVSELWFEGVAITSNPKLVAAWDDCCCRVVSTYRSTPLSHAVIFSHFGSRWLGWRAVFVLMFFSSASNKRLSASNSLSWEGKNKSKSFDFT